MKSLFVARTLLLFYVKVSIYIATCHIVGHGHDAILRYQVIVSRTLILKKCSSHQNLSVSKDGSCSNHLQSALLRALWAKRFAAACRERASRALHLPIYKPTVALKFIHFSPPFLLFDIFSFQSEYTYIRALTALLEEAILASMSAPWIYLFGTL